MWLDGDFHRATLVYENLHIPSRETSVDLEPKVECAEVSYNETERE